VHNNNQMKAFSESLSELIIASYLQNHKPPVAYNNSESKNNSQISGVPQGLSLGSFLFLLPNRIIE
jgi:hypothetical protein